MKHHIHKSNILRSKQRINLRQSTWMSASETPKSRLETRSFPPVSMPAPPLPPAAPLKPLKPLSNMSCCHLSGSCLGCNRWKRTHLLTSGSPCLCQSQSTRLGVGASRGLRILQGQDVQLPQEGPQYSLPTPSLQASESVQTGGHTQDKQNKKDVLCTTYTYSHSIDFDVYNNVLRLYTFCYNSRIKIEHYDN